MALTLNVTTSSTPADTAVLGDYLFNRYVQAHYKTGQQRDFFHQATNNGLNYSVGALYPVLKAFSMQPAQATTLAAFQASLSGQQATDVAALVTAIQTAVTADEAANGGGVASVTVTAGGTGYTSAPTVAFTSGGGTGAAGTAKLGVLSVTITAGTLYTVAPTVAFAAPGGGGITATGTVTIPGGVPVVTVTNAGSGYTSVPVVTFSGGTTTGVAAAGTAVLEVVAVTVTTHGSGYTSAPTVGFSGGVGTGAAAKAVLEALNAYAGLTPFDVWLNNTTGLDASLTAAINAATVTGGSQTYTVTTTPIVFGSVDAQTINQVYGVQDNH